MEEKEDEKELKMHDSDVNDGAEDDGHDDDCSSTVIGVIVLFIYINKLLYILKFVPSKH